MRITLYGAAYCHLCCLAKAILNGAGVDFLYMDINQQDDLFDKYALRIPVLYRIDTEMELNWPFDESAVLQFLA
jgi:hypothetical protein